MQFFKNNVTFFHKIVCVYRKSLVSLNIAIVITFQFCENLNFITFDELNINLGKTNTKLRIFLRFLENRAPGHASHRTQGSSSS